MITTAELLATWENLSEEAKEAAWEFMNELTRGDEGEAVPEIVMDQVVEGNQELLEEMRH